MKKILFLGGLLLSAMTFVSCNGDYDDWADPQSNPQEEAVIHCHWNEYGKAERSRCFCFRRKFRRYPCRRTGYRWKNPRN